jgi:hypothetical protein
MKPGAEQQTSCGRPYSGRVLGRCIQVPADIRVTIARAAVRSVHVGLTVKILHRVGEDSPQGLGQP